jgi:hypothetical protein
MSKMARYNWASCMDMCSLEVSSGPCLLSVLPCLATGDDQKTTAFLHRE